MVGGNSCIAICALATSNSTQSLNTYTIHLHCILWIISTKNYLTLIGGERKTTLQKNYWSCICYNYFHLLLNLMIANRWTTCRSGGFNWIRWGSDGMNRTLSIIFSMKVTIPNRNIQSIYWHYRHRSILNWYPITTMHTVLSFFAALPRKFLPHLICGRWFLYCSRCCCCYRVSGLRRQLWCIMWGRIYILTMMYSLYDLK